MVAKNCSARVPALGALRDEDEAMLAAADVLIASAGRITKFRPFNRALDAIWKVIADANRYFAAQEPWALRRSDPERMATVLYVTAEILRQIGILIQPYMPVSAARLLELLGIAAGERTFAHLGAPGRLRSGVPLPAPQPIFPRYVEAVDQVQPHDSASGADRRQSLSSRLSRTCR